MNIEEARRRTIRADSTNRLGVIVALCDEMDEGDWLTLLGENWTICDGVYRHLDFILFESPVAHSEEPVREMMTDEEWEQLQELPEKFPVFRGCFVGVNDDGHCYSLNKDVAWKFTQMNRYTHATAPAIIRCGYAYKSDVIALKTDRNENEVLLREFYIEENLRLDDREWPDDLPLDY